MLAAPAVAAETSPDLVVEAVRVDGVGLLRRDAIQRRLDLAPGAPLVEAEVQEARLRLLATGLFERVDARLEKGSARGRVVVVFECTERGTASVDAIHLGHARPTLLWGGLEASDLDPFALGFSVAAGFVSSEDQHAGRLAFGRRELLPDLDATLGFRYLHGLEPFVGPSGQRLGGETVSQIEVPYRRAGADLGGRYALGSAVLLFGAHGEWLQTTLPGDAEQLEPDGRRRPFAFDAPDGDTAQGVLSLGLEYDARDDPANPSRGTRASLITRGGAGAGAFVGALASLEHALRLPFGHVLRGDAKVGGLLGSPPFFERFFIGDLHPYIPGRALGVNFARRRGPNLLDTSIVQQRYETVAGRAGLEYRIPLNRSSADDPYGVEVFLGSALLSLFSPEELDTGAPFPLDLALDFGLRIDSEIGVMGISVGNIFLLIDP